MTLGRFIDQLARIVSNPGSNLTGAVLLLAMVVLVLLILAVAALITILPGDDEDEEEQQEREPVEALPRQGARPKKTEARERLSVRRIGREQEKFLVVALPVMLVLAGLVWGWYVTSDPQRCGSCHATSAAADSWRTGDHRRVGCVSCHEDGGLGLAAAAAYRTTDLVASLRGQETAEGAERGVPSYRCLRCHRDVPRGTATVGAVRVSHRAFLAAGYACQRCHLGIGHSGKDAPERAVDMGQCVPCHDGKKASAECRTCHVGDPSGAVRVDRALFAKVEITPPPGCSGCHQTKTCLACHGIEMPHPAGFDTGKGHARLAAFEKKQTVCYRCHVPADCNRCHKGDFPNHPGDWKRDHGSNIPLDGRNACACHSTPNFCGLCHTTSAKR